MTAGRVKVTAATLARAAIDAAEMVGAGRVFLVGPKPKSSDWLDGAVPDGWLSNGHFYELRDPCGRWINRASQRLEVRRVAAWFGEGDYTVADARRAMAATHVIVQRGSRGFAGVMGSPAATGQSWWAATVKPGQLDEQTPDDVQDLIRATSPQHREEVLGACHDGCDMHLPGGAGTLPGLFYLDAVFMYGACCRELGARAILLDSPRLARAHYDAYPYGRARYLIRSTIPGGWCGPGLLPVKHPNGRNWHYPNRAGVEIETWADAVEVALAREQGWPIEPLSVIRYEEGKRPLDTFADAIVRERTRVLDGPADRQADMIANALRSMFIRTLGAFTSRGRERSYVVASGVDLPAGVTEWDTRENGDRVYTVRHELTGNAAAFMRPELASQVWARARTKVARKMLDAAPGSLVAVWGDALYVGSQDEATRLYDDATVPGSFRVKGSILHPVERPGSISQLLKLRREMGNNT